MRSFPNRQPPPGDTRDPERNLAKRAKESGHTRDDYLTTRVAAIHATAVAQGWDRITYQAAVFDVECLADEIFGAPASRIVRGVR